MSTAERRPPAGRSVGALIIAPDILEHPIHRRHARWAPVMPAQAGDSGLQLVFSRAFLLELERGNLERATLFARAFLKQRASA